MPLTILSIAYPFAPVGGHAVGGAEVVLTSLDRAVAAEGHRSIVVACEGSRTAGLLAAVPLPRGEVLTEADRAWCRVQMQRVIDAVLSTHRVDLVHMHGLDFHEYRIPSHIPVLATLHLPVDWYPADLWARLPANLTLCCVSQSQRSSGGALLRNAAVVGNGVALPPIDLAGEKRHFAVAVGRICPEKNVHEALLAGTRAGMPVLVAGKVFPYETHQQYFRTCVQPLLNESPMHSLLGPVDREGMHALLRQAICLLHPTVAPETSSLVAMEALAAGTPVIAYGAGALPEIVEHGHTGFLVQNVEEMAEAMRKVEQIGRAACRNAAEQRFSEDRMIRGYLDLYNDILFRHSTHTGRRYA